MIKDSANIHHLTGGSPNTKPCKIKRFCKTALAPARIDLKILSLQLNLVN
jgi:hypothetical protein